MEIQPDFKELFALLNQNQVEYIVVGAFAFDFHGSPHFSGDIDIYVLPTPDTARRVWAALRVFGFASLGLKCGVFDHPGEVIQLGHPPARIDFLTSISGVTWEEANAGKAPGQYGDVSVPYLGRRQLIANKRALGRKKDLADLESLGEV